MYPKKMKTETNNLRFLKDKDLESRRTILIAKISHMLRIKHKNILNESSFDIKSALNNYLTKEKMLNFNYDSFILDVESEILNQHSAFNAGLNNKNKKSKGLMNSVDSRINSVMNYIESDNTLLHNTNIITDNSNQQKEDNINNNNVVDDYTQKQFYSYTSPFDKKSKLEDLKNRKEKDEWALLAKKDYHKYIDEKRNKSQSLVKQKKEVKEILADQIKDRNIFKKSQDENNINFLNHLNLEYDQWRREEEMKKNEHSQKVHQNNQYNDYFIKEKNSKEKDEKEKILLKEKVNLNKILNENINEKKTMEKKKENDKKIFQEQIEHVILKDLNKKNDHLNEIETEKKTLQEYDKIMEKLDQDRFNLKEKIKQKAKILDLRQSMIKNVKDSENEIKRELDNKYLREKEEIEKRNKIIEEYNQLKKKELLDEVKITIETQKAEKKNRDLLLKEMNREFDNKLQISYNDYKNQREESEQKRMLNIYKYKIELDKQIFEKNERMKKPIMGEVERQINRANL